MRRKVIWDQLNESTAGGNQLLLLNEASHARFTTLEYEGVAPNGKIYAGAEVAVDGLWQVSARRGEIDIELEAGGAEHWVVCMFPRMTG